MIKIKFKQYRNMNSKKKCISELPHFYCCPLLSLMVAIQTFVKYIYIHKYVLRPLVLFLYKWAYTIHLFYNFLYSLTTS